MLSIETNDVPKMKWENFFEKEIHKYVEKKKYEKK